LTFEEPPGRFRSNLLTAKVSCHFYPLKARLLERRLQLFQGITPLKVGLTNPVVVTIRQLVEKGQLMDDPVFHVVIGKAAPDKHPLLVFILVIIHIAGIDNIGLVGLIISKRNRPSAVKWAKTWLKVSWTSARSSR
jgi:hypothetical protein